MRDPGSARSRESLNHLARRQTRTSSCVVQRARRPAISTRSRGEALRGDMTYSMCTGRRSCCAATGEAVGSARRVAVLAVLGPP